MNIDYQEALVALIESGFKVRGGRLHAGPGYYDIEEIVDAINDGTYDGDRVGRHRRARRREQDQIHYVLRWTDSQNIGQELDSPRRVSAPAIAPPTRPVGDFGKPLDEDEIAFLSMLTRASRSGDSESLANLACLQPGGEAWREARYHVECEPSEDEFVARSSVEIATEVLESGQIPSWFHAGPFLRMAACIVVRAAGHNYDDDVWRGLRILVEGCIHADLEGCRGGGRNAND